MAVYVDIQTVDRQASHRGKELLACYTIWREVMNLAKEYYTLLTWHKCHNSFCIPTEKILYMEKGLIDARDILVYCLWCSSVVLLSQWMFNICVQIWTISIFSLFYKVTECQNKEGSWNFFFLFKKSLWTKGLCRG